MGKTGAAFWSAFWFETPFALFRCISGFIIPIVAFFFAYKAHKLYIAAQKRA